MTNNENKTAKTNSTISYSHCVKYTAGQLDVEGFSSYERRVVGVNFWKIPSEDLVGQFDFVCRDESGEIIGDGLSVEECKHDASYSLMNASRELEEAKSLASQGAK